MGFTAVYILCSFLLIRGVMMYQHLHLSESLLCLRSVLFIIIVSFTNTERGVRNLCFNSKKTNFPKCFLFRLTKNKHCFAVHLYLHRLYQIPKHKRSAIYLDQSYEDLFFLFLLKITQIDLFKNSEEEK